MLTHMRFTTMAIVAWHVLLCSTTAAQHISVEPIPPNFAAPYYAVYSDINVEEGTAVETHLLIHGNLTASLANSTTRVTFPNATTGWWATLLRQDLGYRFLTWTSASTIRCRVFAGCPAIAVPSADGWGYLHDVVSFGANGRDSSPSPLPRRLAQSFGIQVGRYAAQRIFDHPLATGPRPIAVNNVNLDGIPSIMTEFAAGPDAEKWVPDAAFAVPPSCQTELSEMITRKRARASSGKRGPTTESRRTANSHCSGDVDPFTTTAHMSLRQLQFATAAVPVGEDAIPFRTDGGKAPMIVPHASVVSCAYSSSDHLSFATMPFAPPPSLLLSLPASADHRMYTTPPRNQGICGACWAFGSAAVAEVVLFRSVLRQPVPPRLDVSLARFSVQHLMDCAFGNVNHTWPGEAKGCHGGSAYIGLSYIAAYGAVAEIEYPYQGSVLGSCLVPPMATRYKPIASVAVIAPNRVNHMMAAVISGGAVAVAIGESSSFLSYQGRSNFEWGPSIYNDTSCPVGQVHVVVIVGYGTVAPNDHNGGVATPYWIVKNSFGAAWGDAGYVYVARGLNICGIESNAVAVTPLP